MSRTRLDGPRTRVGAAEFKARCLELIDRVKETRTEYVVTRHGEPVARLVPIENPDDTSLLGCMTGTLVRFDRPLDPAPGAWSLAEPLPEAD